LGNDRGGPHHCSRGRSRAGPPRVIWPRLTLEPPFKCPGCVLRELIRTTRTSRGSPAKARGATISVVRPTVLGYYNTSHGQRPDAREATLRSPHQAGGTLPVQGDRDQARCLALQATWWAIERPQDARGTGAHRSSSAGAMGCGWTGNFRSRCVMSDTTAESVPSNEASGCCWIISRASVASLEGSGDRASIANTKSLSLRLRPFMCCRTFSARSRRSIGSENIDISSDTPD
jgi:hypothetical protein